MIFSNTVLGIIGIACLAVLFSEASGIVDTLKWKLVQPSFGRRLKPFDCPMCLAFWIGLSYALLNAPIGFRYAFCSLLFASTCSIMAIFISKAVRS